MSQEFFEAVEKFEKKSIKEVESLMSILPSFCSKNE